MDWWPRQTPRIGILPAKRLDRRHEIPASVGVQGPGEMTMLPRREPLDLVERQLVVADHPHLRPELAEVTARG